MLIISWVNKVRVLIALATILTLLAPIVCIQEGILNKADNLENDIKMTEMSINEYMEGAEKYAITSNYSNFDCSKIKPGVYDKDDELIKYCFGINEDGSVDYVPHDSILRYENNVKIMKEVIEYSLNQTNYAYTIVNETLNTIYEVYKNTTGE